MNRVPLLLALSGASLVLSGCVAKTAYDVATLPVRVAARGVDLATTSQAEADRNRGREIRQREEQLGKLERERERLNRKCRAGEQRACAEAEKVAEEIREFLPTVPLERR